MNINDLLPIAIHAAEEACKEIMEVYTSGDFQAEVKGDNSPLTIADKRAHDRIVEILEPTRLPILSEEGKEIPYEERKTWEHFWMIDPLDGTKEFLKKNGEFTVNIALVQNGKPVLGVVALPATAELFYGTEEIGTYKKIKGKITRLNIKNSIDLSSSGLRVVASRSHMSEETQNFIDKLKEPTLVSAGSSLKFMLLVEGKADIYPRFAPTMEWDTAASHAIINSVKRHLYQSNTKNELEYNKENLLNPYFICY